MIFASPAEAHSSSSYTVEEAIEKMGFGMFQIKMLALCGTAWVSDKPFIAYNWPSTYVSTSEQEK